MRAIGLHEDVIVLESRVWRTTCTAIRGTDEAFVVDSLVYPDELELLPAVLEQASFTCSGLLATHADWDHLLGRLAFPSASLGLAETSAARLAGEPGAPQRELRAFDERHYVRRPTPLGLGRVEALGVPGYCGLGERELELHPADGHTDDGMAIWIGWACVLICGDYLSPVEIPTIGGSLSGYRSTLERLGALIDGAEHVVPGHGGVLTQAQAKVLLAEDRAYIDALEAGASPKLPRGRAGAEQRRLHAANLAFLSPKEHASARARAPQPGQTRGR